MIITGNLILKTSSYTSDKVVPYVYKCVHRKTGKLYIGARSNNKEPSHIDLPKYKTSSKIVKPNFDEYDWEIIAESYNKKDIFEIENELILEHLGKDYCLNFHAKDKFISAGRKRNEASRLKLSKSISGLTKENCEWRKKQAETVTGRTKDTHEYIKIQSELRRGQTKFTHVGYAKSSITQKGRTKENNEGVKKTAEAITGLTTENCEWRKRAGENISKTFKGITAVDSNRVAKMAISKMKLSDEQRKIVEEMKDNYSYIEIYKKIKK
jgi:hypothetical protein